MQQVKDEEEPNQGRLGRRKNMYSPPYSTKDRGSLKDEQGFNRQRKNWEPQTEQA